MRSENKTDTVSSSNNPAARVDVQPLCIDLFCGLFGWGAGFLAEGYRVVGFDHEQRGSVPEGAEFVLQDVLTLHGSKFRNAAVIVASPPCQAYSYRAMPWKRAKALPPPDNTLFEACFRIQREACEAAGRYIPLVVENVKGAQPWVGRAKWHYGSFYLWGDVPALMPFANHRKGSNGIPSGSAPKGAGDSSWFFGKRCDPRDVRQPDGSWLLADGSKVPGLDWSKHGQPDYKAKGFNVTAAQRFRAEQGVKQNGSGPVWFDTGIAKHSSRSDSRKAASAQIAKIPYPLALHITQVYKPRSIAEVA